MQIAIMRLGVVLRTASMEALREASTEAPRETLKRTREARAKHIYARHGKINKRVCL